MVSASDASEELPANTIAQPPEDATGTEDAAEEGGATQAEVRLLVPNEHEEILSRMIISPDYVNAGPAESLTSSGYIRFAMDMQTINATAIPTRGKLSDGQIAEGYGFQISNFGTMPISGGSKARAVYSLLKQQARGAGELLRVSP